MRPQLKSEAFEIHEGEGVMKPARGIRTVVVVVHAARSGRRWRWRC